MINDSLTARTLLKTAQRRGARRPASKGVHSQTLKASRTNATTRMGRFQQRAGGIMFPHLHAFNLRQWIDENRGNWGQRRVIWEDSDFIAFVTRGPNRRKDFHINPGDEIFYQLEGELNLHYLKNDKHELSVLNKGDIFLLPATVPHSPRRGEGSWTLVVERKRRSEELDRFIWACEQCGHRLYETTVRFDDPSGAVAQATASIQSNPELATCGNCSARLVF
jgi:3-hydroxyanthranilate 3,4-dioxygenase